jgi:hypothetical protein
VQVSVVIPWRSTEFYRVNNLAYVRTWYAATHPDWEVVVAELPGDGPWVKAVAVHLGVQQAAGDVIVVADGDVITPNIGACVAEVTAGRAAWAVPHHAVYRLRPYATEDLWMNRRELPDWRVSHTQLRATIAEVHKGVAGGGSVVLSRSLWANIPMDARFTGWGQEDLAWGWALTRVHGLPFQPNGPCYHLWHPPQQRLSRSTGSNASRALWARYSRAYTAAEVLALLGEPGAHPATVEPVAAIGSTDG